MFFFTIGNAQTMKVLVIFYELSMMAKLKKVLVIFFSFGNA